MSDQNLQQYMQQQQQQQQQNYQQYAAYSQSQLYPYNPYSSGSWDPLQHAEGPSFTGEASVFQGKYGRGEGGSDSPTGTRDAQYDEMYRDSRRRERSRSRSRGRDDELSDPAAQKRLKDTLKRLRQLEQTHYMQDQLLKDMRRNMGDNDRGRSTSDHYDRHSYSSRGTSGSMLTAYSSSRLPESSSSSSLFRDSGVMCYKCNKKGHFAKYCPVKDKLCYLCNQSGHISKECPSGPSRPDPDKSCYTCGKKGHLAHDCPQNMDKSCYTCGKRGHIAADCTIGTEKHCYTCGKKGHVSADCMTDRCFKCEYPGHRAADCTSTRKRSSSYSNYNDTRSPKGKVGDQKCLRCGGYGHKIKMCPSTGSTDEKRKCHYCQGVGHLARHCISPGVITKPDEEKAKTKVDAETKYMAQEIAKFAKSSYPVREGSKTRAEIDEALKGMGARHRILEKELPPCANKTDTTISNQCIFLSKLKWKDMICDKLVDNLYCYICQRSLPSSKYYQEHVTSKEHHNFLSTLLGAKPGWAVRTKLLKKICGLPSIFVDDDNDDGNDDDGGKEDGKTSSGKEKNERRAIKPELYSTDAKDTKYFMCRVCHSWGETPLQDHFGSDKHKFLYENQWKCEDCNIYFRAYSDFTQHCDSLLHKQVLVKTGKASDGDDDTNSNKKRSLDSSSDDHLAAKRKRYSINAGEEDTLGFQFLLPVTGFYCKLCQKFYNEAKVSETDHCNAQLHQSKLQSWRVENELKKGVAQKGDNSEEKTEGANDENKNGEGEKNVSEGNGNIEVMQQGQETEDVDIEGSGGDATTSATNDEWMEDVVGEVDDDNDILQANTATNDDGQQESSEPLEAEISSDEDDDDETIRATRRGRVTRSAKTPGQSPKGGKKRTKKL